MPSGPKKRRANKRREDDEAKIKDPNAAKSEEVTRMASNTVVVEDNSSTIEADTVVDLANPADARMNHEEFQGDVEVGSKKNEEKALPSVDESTLRPPIVSVSKESNEAELSKDKPDMDYVQNNSKEIEEYVLLQGHIDGPVVQDAMKDNKFVCEGMKANPFPSSDESSSALSLVTLTSQEQKEEKAFPSPKEDARASLNVEGFAPKEIEYEIVQGLNVSTVETDSKIEHAHDFVGAEFVDSGTSNKKLYSCPLHCNFDCSFNQWVGGESDGVYSCQDENASEDGKKSKWLLERVTKKVEAELCVADKVTLLLQKMLDDLKAIQLTEEH